MGTRSRPIADRTSITRAARTHPRRREGRGCTVPAPRTRRCREHDRLRRQRLVGLITLGIGGLSAVLLPSAFIPTLDGVSVIALLILLVGSCAAYVVNRLNHVSIAGYLLLAGGSLAVAWLIGTRGMQGGLTPTDLRLC